MKVIGDYSRRTIWLAALAGAALPFLFTPALSDGAYELPEPNCLTVKKYTQKVDLNNLSSLAPKDVINLTVARRDIPELAQLNTIYIDRDYDEFYTMKADISPRTVVFPYESCPSGCVGYIVNATEHGLSYIKFYYRYNVEVEPRGIVLGGRNNDAYGGLILLDIDKRNIIVLQRRDRKLQDAPTITIAPASLIKTYYSYQKIYHNCLLDAPAP